MNAPHEAMLTGNAIAATCAVVATSWVLTQSLLWMNFFPVLYFLYCQGQDDCCQLYEDRALLLTLPFMGLGILRMMFWLDVFPVAFVAYQLVVHDRFASMVEQESLVSDCSLVSYGGRHRYDVSVKERCDVMNKRVERFFRHKKE